MGRSKFDFIPIVYEKKNIFWSYLKYKQTKLHITGQHIYITSQIHLGQIIIYVFDSL